jgi:hypothetical protein
MASSSFIRSAAGSASLTAKLLVLVPAAVMAVALTVALPESAAAYTFPGRIGHCNIGAQTNANTPPSRTITAPGASVNLTRPSLVSTSWSQSRIQRYIAFYYNSWSPFDEAWSTTTWYTSTRTIYLGPTLGYVNTNDGGLSSC